MKNHIGYLPQYPNFFSWMTASETLAFMGTLSVFRKSITKRHPNSSGKGGLRKRGTCSCWNIFRRYETASWNRTSFITQAPFIIMDEPVSALDPIGRREVLNLLKDIKRNDHITFYTYFRRCGGSL